MTNFKQFEEVMKLIRETGDRCVILLDGHEPYIVMDIDSYRGLLEAAAAKQSLSHLTEEELLTRINQEIGEWRENKSRELMDYDLAQFRVAPREPAPISYEATPEN